MAIMDVKRLIPATRINMYDIVNPEGEDLGQVQNFMVDPETGRIVFLIVSFGGILGLTDKWIAVPMDVLSYDIDNGNFIMDVPREILEKAPGIDKDKWPYELNLDWLEEVYTCFGCQPYWESHTRWTAKKTGGVETLTVAASWLKGHSIKDAAGNEIGKIDDLIMDLRSGYMTYAITDINAYEALKNRKIAIPIEAFSIGGDNESLQLNIERVKLENAPVFDPASIKVDSNTVGKVYTYYGYSSYWNNRNIWQRRSAAVHPESSSMTYQPDLYPISDLMGAPVFDVQNKDIGRIDDLMIDLQSGYLASAILVSGNILDVGEKYYPIPLEVLSFDPVKKTFYLSVDRETVQEAPAFDKDRLPFVDRQGLIDVYAAYGYTPYWRETHVYKV